MPRTGTPMPQAAPTAQTPWPNIPGSAPNVVGAVAAGPVDEASEIWLVQKNKLDFGPFSLGEVKRQIQKGDIEADHVLVDSDSGRRWRVGDHPHLAAFVTEVSSKRAADQQAAADRDRHRKDRHRAVTIMAACLILAACAIGGALIWKARQAPVVVERVVEKPTSDADLEKVLRGLSFEFPKPVIKSHKPGRGGPGKRGGGPPGVAVDDFDEPTHLGDVTQEGGEEQLSQEQIQSVMNSRGRPLALCIAEERRRNPDLHQIDLDFIVHGNGQVSAVRVNGQKGTPFASCMYGKMKQIAFPKFNGPKTIAGFSWNLR
jgi:hypothetical protein